MFSITVPNSRSVVSEDERPFTVYQVNVQVEGRTHVVEKRYREFHSMHKQVKKSVGVDTPEFPPKKIFQLSSKEIEQRRQTLENYLQTVMNGDVVPKSFLNFLKVKNFKTTSYDSLDELGRDSFSFNHQPVMVFEDDPFLAQSSDESFVDILTEGVRQGMYEDSDSDNANTHSGIG